MKTIISIFFAAIITVASYAQTGVLLNRFYIAGSLSLGQNSRVYSDTTAWLQIGKDTTNRGVLMPKVLLDSINTTKRALFVYDLKDSVLYHFDGNKKVRYMTYKDTIFIKQMILGGLNTNSIPEGDSHQYYSDSKARAALSAGTGISYNNSTGVISNTGVTSVNGSAGAISLDNTYFKQGGNTFSTDAVLGTTNTKNIRLATNGITRFMVNGVSGNSTIYGGDSREDCLTIENGQSNKLILGVGLGGATSMNVPFILFGTDGTRHPRISSTNFGDRIIEISNANILDLHAHNFLDFEIRGGGYPQGSVISIGSSANGGGGGHTGTAGTLNWLTVPMHIGDNSDIRPISGNMAFNIINIVPNINQTGTANGVTRGIYINPNIMSAPNFRAIEMTNTVGYGIYQTALAIKNYFNGNVGIRTTTPSEALEVNGNIKTAQPSVNGAGAWKLGKIVTGAAVTVQTDKYIEVEIDGVIRKLAIVE